MNNSEELCRQKALEKTLNSFLYFIYSIDNLSIKNKKSALLCIYNQDVWHIIIGTNRHYSNEEILSEHLIGSDSRVEILKMVEGIPAKSKKNLIYLIVFMIILLLGSYFILPIKGLVALTGIVFLLVMSKYFFYLDVLAKVKKVIDVLSGLSHQKNFPNYSREVFLLYTFLLLLVMLIYFV